MFIYGLDVAVALVMSEIIKIATEAVVRGGDVLGCEWNTIHGQLEPIFPVRIE